MHVLALLALILAIVHGLVATPVDDLAIASHHQDASDLSGRQAFCRTVEGYCGTIYGPVSTTGPSEPAEYLCIDNTNADPHDVPATLTCSGVSIGSIKKAELNPQCRCWFWESEEVDPTCPSDGAYWWNIYDVCPPPILKFRSDNIRYWSCMYDLSFKCRQ